MTKLYSIPKIVWKTSYLLQGNLTRKVETTENTFISYYIHFEVDDMYRCYYGNGRFRDFNTLEEAKEWVSEVHYPAQVAKYFKENNYV